MPDLREQVARAIMGNVRCYKSHRHDAKHGRYGVYHFSGVTEAADAILALFSPADGWRPIETAPKDVITETKTTVKEPE